MEVKVCAGSGYILVSMKWCIEERVASEWYWLAGWLGLMPVLIIVLCPFTFLCLPSLPPADVGGWWFYLMMVLSALIEMYWSHVLWATYGTAWILTHNTWRIPYMIHFSLSHWVSLTVTGWPWCSEIKKTKSHFITKNAVCYWHFAVTTNTCFQCLFHSTNCIRCTERENNKQPGREGCAALHHFSSGRKSESSNQTADFV